MMDHQYCESDTYMCNEEISNEKESDIFIEEKDGDALLIELYRERPFLYNKSHKNFKDKLIKDNAWNEISKIMQDRNYGELQMLFFNQYFLIHSIIDINIMINLKRSQYLNIAHLLIVYGLLKNLKNFQIIFIRQNTVKLDVHLYEINTIVKNEF